jgi:hypothetical protein
MDPPEFITLLGVRIFTDDEIAHWLRTHPYLSAKEKLEFMQTLQKIKTPPITGIIRTAIRELDGLPPVPGDAT